MFFRAAILACLALPMAAQTISAPATPSSTSAAAPSSEPGDCLVSGQHDVPYSLLQTVTNVKTLPDGVHITRVSKVRILRDSEGRQRDEQILVGNDGKEKVLSISILDPVACTRMSLNPLQKTARLVALSQHKPIRSEGQAQPKVSATPVSRRFSSESLGQRNVAGFLVTGKRSMFVVPVGERGNDREFTVTLERWHSPELNADLESITDDPMIGKSTTVVSDVQRSEPDAKLFHIPEDYKVEADSRKGM